MEGMYAVSNYFILIGLLILALVSTKNVCNCAETDIHLVTESAETKGSNQDTISVKWKGKDVIYLKKAVLTFAEKDLKKINGTDEFLSVALSAEQAKQINGSTALVVVQGGILIKLLRLMAPVTDSLAIPSTIVPEINRNRDKVDLNGKAPSESSRDGRGEPPNNP